jgi:hypothetical protein
MPLHGPEQAAQDEADERAGDPRHVVDPERETPLVMGERIGQDRRGIGEQEGAPDALEDPHDDEPHRACDTGHPGHRQQNGEHGEDDEAQVVHADPAVHIAEPPEAHHQDGRHDHEAHEEPE